MLAVLVSLLVSLSPESSPAPTPELAGPVEAVRKFLEGVSATEAAWMIVAWILMGVLYWFSIQQVNRGKTTYRTVLWWIAGLCGWAFSFYLFGWYRIISGGGFPILTSVGSAFLAFVAVMLLKKKSSDWQQIISGTIIIIMGFFIALTIAKGAQALSYAIVFGCTFGMMLGMLVISIQRLNQAPETVTANEWSDERPSGL